MNKKKNQPGFIHRFMPSKKDHYLVPCNIPGWIILRVDNINLQIVRLLARDSRSSYKNIASAVVITPSASKTTVDKLVSNDVMHRFARGTYYKYVSYRLSTR